jgi:hypothetical protein
LAPPAVHFHVSLSLCGDDATHDAIALAGMGHPVHRSGGAVQYHLASSVVVFFLAILTRYIFSSLYKKEGVTARPPLLVL